MVSFHHGWGWQPPQTASCIHIRHIQSVWEHWYAVHRHTVSSSLSQLYSPYLDQIFGYTVTCGVKMMSFGHGWGWQPPQTASLIHFLTNTKCLSTLICCPRAYDSSLTQLYPHTWLKFGGSESLVESKFCQYVLIKTDSHLKLLLSSILDVYKVLKHIHMLSMGIQ